MAITPGQVIDGKYRIERQLGVGGMGAVYEGENVRIHRKVAIKVLHAAVATKADIVQRFEREAQAAGRIGSKHIVEVLDLGNLPDGDRFMVMEYLDGESLGDRLKRVHRFAPADLAPILVQVLEGLAAAHEAGIVHRDLKPDNIYLLKPKSPKDGEFVKILDFGVSKFSSADENMAMTNAGAVMGTPYYLSPEQARGGTVDARSDVYAMGVVGYQLVAGVVPFHADNFNELLFKIALENAKPLVQAVPGIDPHFAAIVERAMAREPAQRFPSAGEMRDVLSAWMQQRGIAAGPSRAPALTNPRASQPGFGLSGTPGPGQSGASLGQSGAPFGQSGNGQSGQWGPAGAPLGQSGAPLGQSGGLARSGGQLGQSGGPLAQSGGPLGQSGGPLAQSGGQLGQSGARVQTPYATPQMPYGHTPGGLGQSGAPLGQSGSPLGQTGSPQGGNALGQSGSPLGQSGGPMGQSSVALAVTTPRASTSPVVFIVVMAIFFVGGGAGGLGWYFFSDKGSTPAAATATPTADPTPSAQPETEPKTEPSTAPSQAAPAESAAVAPSAEPSASAAVAPSAGSAPATPPKPPTPATTPVAVPPKPPAATPPKPPAATPPKPPTTSRPATAPTGRAVSGTL
jgi:serine/threonine protein kinase